MGDDGAVFDPFKAILLAYSPDHIIEDMRAFARYHCQNPQNNSEQKWSEQKFKGTVKNFWSSGERHKKLLDEIFQSLWGIRKGEK